MSNQNKLKLYIFIALAAIFLNTLYMNRFILASDTDLIRTLCTTVKWLINISFGAAGLLCTWFLYTAKKSRK